jgi:hypothetical protein
MADKSLWNIPKSGFKNMIIIKLQNDAYHTLKFSKEA